MTLQHAIKNLLTAIKSNTIENVNIGNEFGKDTYKPMVPLQYINDEINDVKKQLKKNTI